MKESITILPFTLDANTGEMDTYFEIHGSSADPVIYLCKVVNTDVVTTINKVGISRNTKYAEWLIFIVDTYSKDAWDTPLEYLYNNNHWFVSTEHRVTDKYIRELVNYLRTLKGE